MQSAIACENDNSSMRLGKTNHVCQFPPFRIVIPRSPYLPQCTKYIERIGQDNFFQIVIGCVLLTSINAGR